MSSRRRLRRLEKKIAGQNLDDKAKALVFDLLYPPIYDSDLTGKQIKKRRRKDAVRWVKRWHELAEIERNTPYKPIAYIHNFCLQRSGDNYGNIVDRVIGYQEYKNGINDIAQEIIEDFNISEDEYKDDPGPTELDGVSSHRNN